MGFTGNCQDTGAGRQGHWLVMWSLLFLSFFFFLLERRAFSGSGNLNFFFFIQLLPHLSHLRASHISHKKIISVHRKLRTVSGPQCIYLLGTFIEHLGVLASPQVLGTRREQDTSQASGSSAL